jgi:phage terminase large subunit
MSKKAINFNPELFNNVFWHIYDAFHSLAIRFIWIYGGSSAAKTYSVVQNVVIDMLDGSDNNTLVLRKYSVDLRDSIYSDFKAVISDWQLEELFVIQQNYIRCVTGSYVRFRGLDDSEKIKGISSFKRVILEEISQFDEADLKQIRKRLRGRSGQQIIGLFNPISEEHWIKVNVFDKEVLTEIDTQNEAVIKGKEVEDWAITGKWLNDKGNTLIIKVNYTDNYWIVGKWRNGKLVGGFVDQHTIDDFEKDKVNDYAYYLVYGLGNWGKLRTGGEFWKDFNPNLHIRDLKWNEDLPIHITWDENVNPYLTCLVWQISGKDATQIDEICLEDPRNRIKHVCGEFTKRYPMDRVKGLFVYGDRTSLKEDTKKEKGENFFTDILMYLKDYRPQLRLQSVNPSVVQSGQFINEIYARNEGGVSITINTKCKKSIHDYQYSLEDSDGTLKKSKKTHPITKVSYEEFGHPSDAKRYFITTAFANEYAKYKSGRNENKITYGKNSLSKNRY